ncbi:hypothetical protein Dd703_1392 [Musicola paradisiaca Ech703]|uniref:Uncharacterized protein n=1 Tax=Musicola paradisiaca (strain Ech703) TaxID=579405 RepID=C6CDS7_MUSP7|nr:hypothetical protein Dd703_1392 [Musicola paradisiaca Ech703]
MESLVIIISWFKRENLQQFFIKITTQKSKVNNSLLSCHDINSSLNDRVI